MAPTPTQPTAAQRRVAAAQAAAVRDEQRLNTDRAAAVKRRKAAAKAQRIEARDRQRGDALAQLYAAAGTRDQWSIIGVTVSIHAVSVHTDLGPGNDAAFTAACTQLIDQEPWIDTIEVIGTDGVSHASWARGDAVCQTAQ